ncbi:HNH endonuclease signature motif containing protein [Nocardioides okcheonensis]|uniref:HNH endonuclease signature motif containing protein n=1 Tax=Nocardioides okcheonensis TaxID=2894081 RepID=UPI001E2EB11D|nr:HNH endonuclease signature motif containing protein [Nocardioides okcheonensis]UFN43648.1 HNH endonuclease [Nocardioides okcheonensis]
MAAVLERVHATLTEVGGLSLTGLGDADVVRVLDELTSASSRLTRQVCRTAAEADQRRFGDTTGARHTHQRWAGRSRHTHAEAARLTRLGRAFEDDLHAPTGQALADGRIRIEQARVIVAAVDAIPTSVRCTDGSTRIIDPSARTQARDHLLKAASEHDAKALRRLGRRILDVVAPELGEAQEAATLAAEEARADAGVELTLTDDGHGRCHGRFTIPSHAGAMFKRHLQALANPARHTDDELRDEHGNWKPLHRRMGEAFVEYIERYPEDATPQTAGVNATVVITMTLEQLLGEHATALLDDGTRMSAAMARRLACEAGIIPAVLDGEGRVLDLGRARRLFTKAQRIALGLRDHGCTARGCETTASGCHAHHDDPWSNGGTTDLANGRLLCPRHHRLAHDPRYAKTVHADNQITFHRRT